MNIVGGYFHETLGFPAFRHEATDFRLPIKSLPENVKPGSANYYHLGVRPEDLALTDKPDPFCQGVVTGLEHRGFDHVVTIAGKGPEIKVIAEGAVPDWGDVAGAEVLSEKIFLFDRRGILMTTGLWN